MKTGGFLFLSHVRHDDVLMICILVSIRKTFLKKVLNFDSFETKGRNGSEQNSPTEDTTEKFAARSNPDHGNMH